MQKKFKYQYSHSCVRISNYWPEFGQKGKEKTTVADLMRHEVTDLRMRLISDETLEELV